MDTFVGQPILSDVTNTVVERRKDERFQINDMGFVALDPSTDIKGKILNLSRPGLAFRYVTKDWRPCESGVLNILLLGGTWRLVNVPFETVWNTKISYDFSFGTVAFGQCGVHFGKLSDLQKSELENFIRYHNSPKMIKRLERRIYKHVSVKRLTATFISSYALSTGPYVPTN